MSVYYKGKADLNINIPPKPSSEHDIISNWKGNHDKPIVSILCHTYQHVDFIEDALNGFLMQETNFAFEIVVRDDASEDGTKTIVEKYAIKYPGIIKAVLEKENTYSRGVKPGSITYPLAKGKYIAFCEGDDYWTDPEKLQKQVDFLELHSEYVMCFHGSVVVDEQGNFKGGNTNSNDEYSKMDLMLGANMSTRTRCYRNVIKEFPREYHNVAIGDVFVASLLGNYGKAKCLKNITPAVYRRHAGGIWAGVGEDKRRCAMAVTFFWLAVYYKRIGKKNIASKHAFSSIMAIMRHLSPNPTTKIKIFLYSIFRK